MSTPIMGLIGNLDNYHVKCDMINTSDRLMVADTLSIMLPYTSDLCKPNAIDNVVGYRDVMRRRKFQLSKCDEIMVINSGGDIPYLIQIEVIYAKEVLHKRISYLYGGCQNAYDLGYDRIIKIWDTGFPYNLRGCKILDMVTDMSKINPPPIDPDLMDKINPSKINKKSHSFNSLDDAINDAFNTLQ